MDKNAVKKYFFDGLNLLFEGTWIGKRYLKKDMDQCVDTIFI